MSKDVFRHANGRPEFGPAGCLFAAISVLLGGREVQLDAQLPVFCLEPSGMPLSQMTLSKVFSGPLQVSECLPNFCESVTMYVSLAMDFTVLRMLISTSCETK
jgi:hypothetical protein